jgi:uracil-DNA glycosylase family protein
MVSASPGGYVSAHRGNNLLVTLFELDDESAGATRYLPETRTLPALREAVQGCRGCHLYENATQAVFGEGSAKAAVMFVGEQPGDQEDLQGKPFVGPAGAVFDKAMAEAGIDRSAAYVTNVVKHFKWEPRGKRRIHQKPNWAEATACRPWLDAELAAVQPDVLVCLGATAAQALLGRHFRVTKERGVPVASELAPNVLATIHPSAILRADERDRDAEYAAFVEDLRTAAALMSSA